MRNRLMEAAVVSVFLVSAAAAQTNISSGSVTGRNWRGPIADAFFTDQSMLTLRPHPEITSNWRNLSEMEKDRVRRDCVAIGGNGPRAGAAPPGVARTTGTTAGRPGALAGPGAKGTPQAGTGETATGATESTSARPVAGTRHRLGGDGAVTVLGAREVAEICSIVGSM
jgi:hypothetical protein